MILDNEISSIKTGWREIIELWKKNNVEKWEKLNKNIEKSLEDIKIFPPKDSPLSCHKKYKEFPPFKDSRPFSKINNLLDNKIKW